jgi:hypothetical protein
VRVDFFQREFLAVTGFTDEENTWRLLLGCVQPDHWNVLSQCFFYDLRGAASSRRGFAIPDGDEEVRLLKHDAPDSFIGNRIRAALAVDLKDRGGFGEQKLKFLARGFTGKVAAILLDVEWDRALQICAQGESGLGDDAITAFGKRRENAQKRRLGRMKKWIVRTEDQIGDGLENLFALSGQACNGIWR